MQAFQALLPPPEILESLLAVTICALLILRTALVVLFSREFSKAGRGQIAVEIFFWLVAVFLAGYLVADMNRAWHETLDRSQITAFIVLSAVGIVVFSGIAITARLGVRFLRPGMHNAFKALYLVLLAGAAAWFVSRTNAPVTFEFSQTPRDSMNLMSEDSTHLAVTDNGAQITLFEIDIRDRSDQAKEYIATSTNTPANAKVIPRGDASINANCHGWVFTGGKYLLKGNSVDMILSDNGYTLQGKPEPGDLIVYRSPGGDCLHTGIVSGILLDGTCIIESKWGIAGRYLHQAEDQPYGLNYAFYRSPRSGHLVTIVHRDDLDAFLTNLKSSPRASSAIEEEDDQRVGEETELQPSLTD